MNLTIVIPFRDGHDTILELLESLPGHFPVLIIDDCSHSPLQLSTIAQTGNVQVLTLESREYFSGAVNRGIEACETDVLVLNQDSKFISHEFFDLLAENHADYALIGERIQGDHPAWPAGYIHGTAMFMQREALDDVGLLNSIDYPLWGSTCEWQVRAARKSWNILPLPAIEGFVHTRKGRFGSAIKSLLDEVPKQRDLFIRTPPAVSVVVSCYNYGRYLEDLVNSFIGGETSIGMAPGQTFQSFEIILVDDHSTDNSKALADALADPWKGIFSIQTERNGGTSIANNAGIEFAHGKYILVMNGDDMRTPDSLETMYRAQVENPHSFVYDNVQILTPEGMKKKVWKMPEFDFEQLLRKNHVHAGIMFPKSAWEEVGGYPELMRFGREDWAFNVALGIAGYCGVHTHTAGYIYRRQGQNRTLRNTTPSWRAKFSAQLQELFPSIYAGERPMTCCGGGRTMATTAAIASKKANVFPGVRGMQLIQYTGGSHGSILYYGLTTGIAYKFSVKNAIRNVDVRDFAQFLDLRENGRSVFSTVKAAKNPSKKSIAKVSEKPVKNLASSPVPNIQQLEKEEEIVAPVYKEDLTLIKGVGIAAQNLLYAEGYYTLELLTKETPENLAAVMFWTQAKAEKVILGAMEHCT